MDNKQWFRQAGFGLMIHWGLYALPAGEWNGTRIPHIGEWLQSYCRIPNKEYHGLTRAFNPVLFNAEEWVKLAKEAGMKYVVFTAKHHEGFCMYPSKASRFNVCDATPFGRDVVGELAEACYKHGLRLGLYYSQDIDWSDPDGGGYALGRTNCGEMSWTNDWDYPDVSKKNYDRCFENKIKPQVTELLKKYKDLLLIWFDTPINIREEQSRQLYDLVKHYQPDCLVNSRIGNGLGDYGSMGDNEIPDVTRKDILFESPCTLNDTWGYKSFDNNWKTPEMVVEILHKVNGHGANYLLNVGPDALGRFPAPAQQVLKEVGEILRGEI